MDPPFFGGLRLGAKPPPNSRFVANSSRWFHKISKIQMMPKIFAVLALLAHGAGAVRSNTWLSEGELELEKVEKRPQFVEKTFKKGRRLKGWIARKLGKKKIEEKEIEKKELDEEIVEQLVDEVQKALQSEEVGFNATHFQLEIFIRLMHFKGLDVTKSEVGSLAKLFFANLVDEKLVEHVHIFATHHQVEEFIRRVTASLRRVTASPILGKTWTEVLQRDTGGVLLRRLAKLYFPLDVGASAVAFCGELVKAVGKKGTYHSSSKGAFIKDELRGDPEMICSQVLTGNLSNNSGAPEWAVDAAEVAEMDGQQHPYGRLDGVAWKHSLKRVCQDECQELVKGIRRSAKNLHSFAVFGSGTIEDACADKVVKHVEAEILGCCSRSCGWNGQFCAFFPFLNSTEQADWQAECCAERNILNGSSRQQLCDSTLSQADKNISQKIVDKRQNNEKDRETLAQDESPASDSWSLMEMSFGGSVDHNTCPTPIDLHKIYKNFFQDWKRMPLTETRQKNKTCEPEDQPSVGECKSFSLMESTDDKGREKYKYKCWDACGWKRPKNPESLHVLAEKVKDEVLGIGGNLFVHKEIYSAWKWT